jgi:hypothetical protein
MHRYVHVTVPEPGALPRNEGDLIGPANEAATDWIRYTPQTLILWTRRDLADVKEVFRRWLPGTNVFVHSVNLSDIPSGAMPQYFWDWLNRHRDAASGYVNWPPLAVPPVPRPAPNLFAPTTLGDALAAITRKDDK